MSRHMAENVTKYSMTVEGGPIKLHPFGIKVFPLLDALYRIFAIFVYSRIIYKRCSIHGLRVEKHCRGFRNNYENAFK